MSKAQILEELPQLGRADRQEIWECLWELEERELLQGVEPAPEEKALLDREWADFQANPEAGAPWPEVQARLRGCQPK